MWRQGKRARRFIVASLISLGANIFVFGEVFAPLKFGPVDVTEIDLQPDQKDDSPPADETPLPPDPPTPPEPKKLADKAKPKPKEKEKEKDKPKPEPPKLAEVKPPPPLPPTPPPPPPPEQKQKLKSVDQDEFPDEKTNMEARYLSQKNHAVKEDKVSNSTNLVHRMSGDKAPSAESDNQDKTTGAAEEKIAELQEREGKTAIAPDSASAGHEQAPNEKEQAKPGALSMRNLMPAAEQKSRDLRRDGVELDDPTAGNLARARAGADRERAEAPRKGSDIRLKVDAAGYDRIVGYDIAAAERQKAARAERSMPKGRYDKYLTKLQAMRSSLENFLPEVKPGNQQELGTRASPFAAYIAAMHRQIHKQWTFGFLTSLESNMGKSSHYDDLTLWTQLEIVLKTDGAVDKVTIVRTSGNMPFDTAALDSVLSAGPFPEPPPVIKSTNGKVYIDWKFHRDERACGTYGADPHILTVAGATIEHDTTEIPKSPQRRPE